ncbi:hypothetical protein K474DRAFT_1661770 [Panus rudis PR-1116 ss-1]|nr:hypothetical protein K474DRAFT_1661770 [Panus rudis PR-1116 ss-1]
MTLSSDFRSCRPFSLLVQSSDAFIEQAQNNLTTLNDIIWGTCNTDTSTDQCESNMAWFSDNIKKTCSTELQNQNPLVIQAVSGLDTYSLLRQTACLADPSTNVYCYLLAAHNSNPSDLYFYQLPLGIKLPNSAKPSCSACTKSVMALYEGALDQGKNGGNGNNATSASSSDGLKKTYDSAANVANGQCGPGYVQGNVVTSGASRSFGLVESSRMVMGVLGVASVLLALLS